MLTALRAKLTAAALAALAWLGCTVAPLAQAGAARAGASGEPLSITKVYPPAPAAGSDVELTIYGYGFAVDDETVKVFLDNGDGAVELTDRLILSPNRITAWVPAQEAVGTASVSVRNSDGGPEATLAGALYFRDPGERWSWQAMVYRVHYDWRGFAEWFKLGGELMYVLALLSFFGVAWAVHCLLVLRRSQVLPRRFLDALSTQLQQGNLRGAEATCRRSKCVFSRMVLGGLRNADEPPEKIRESVNAAGSRESAHLHQKINYLANVGTISPMLGLLGTVFGMIKSFEVISSGNVRYYLLAAAIAKAMVTTAAGLLIGIPAMAFYFYLRGRLLRLMTDMEVVADDVSRTIIERGSEE